MSPDGSDRNVIMTECRHPDNVAVDAGAGHIYWTQKGPGKGGKGRIFRAGTEMPEGQTPTSRADIELLYDGLPEPIDLQLDLWNCMMCWTDRGDPPLGNTVNRAPMDCDLTKRQSPESLMLS